MCGRTATAEEAEIERWWNMTSPNYRDLFGDLAPHPARYNVPPAQGRAGGYIPIVRHHAEKGVEVVYVQWWLLPWWATEPKNKYTTFNARVETVATSRTFAEPFRKRRCLVPVKGWYEWQHLGDNTQPWFFHSKNADEILMLAGVWDRWHKGEQVIESCAIIVGDPPKAVENLHDRAPFIIPRERAEAWLSPDLTDPEEIHCLLEPWNEMDLAWHKVSRAVGNVRNQGPHLIEPMDPNDPF